MLSAILLERSIDKVSRILFWLEILIETTDTLRWASASRPCSPAAREQGHKLGNWLHVLMGAPTARVTDAIASHRGGYYACSPTVHWPAPTAVS